MKKAEGWVRGCFNPRSPKNNISEGRTDWTPSWGKQRRSGGRARTHRVGPSISPPHALSHHHHHHSPSQLLGVYYCQQIRLQQHGTTRQTAKPSPVPNIYDNTEQGGGLCTWGGGGETSCRKCDPVGGRGEREGLFTGEQWVFGYCPITADKWWWGLSEIALCVGFKVRPSLSRTTLSHGCTHSAQPHGN